MTSEEFTAWLSAISGMSAAQRAEALALLGTVGVGSSPSAETKGTGKRTEDALGTTGVERVERQGCPHCAGRDLVGWGRASGLLRFRCKSCGGYVYREKTPSCASAQEGEMGRSRPGDD